MLPLPQESSPDGKVEMATTPEALNLVKSDNTYKEQNASPGVCETTPTRETSGEGLRMRNTKEESRSYDSGNSTRPKSSETLHDVPVSSTESYRHSSGLSMEGVVSYVSTNVENTATSSGGWSQSSTTVGGSANNSRLVNSSDNASASDEEYIDVVSLDPGEDQTHSPMDERRFQPERDRMVVGNVRSIGKTSSFVSEQQVSRKNNEGDAGRNVNEEDRVPSLDSGCYSDDEMRIRARRSSSEWSDIAAEKKVNESHCLFPMRVTHQNLKPVYPAPDDKRGFTPRERVHRMSPPRSDLMASSTDSRQVVSHRSNQYNYPYLQSYGKHTLYIPPELRLAEMGAGRGTVADGLPLSRNSTEVVYTFDTSSVRMCTGTSLVDRPHGHYGNNSVDPMQLRGKRTLVPVVLVKSKTDTVSDHGNLAAGRSTKMSEAMMDVKTVASGAGVKEISSYNSNRAEIIPIPSEKSAFVSPTPTTTQNIPLTFVNGSGRTLISNVNMRQEKSFSGDVPYVLQSLPFEPPALRYFSVRPLLPTNSINQRRSEGERTPGHVIERKAPVSASGAHVHNTEKVENLRNPWEQITVTADSLVKEGKPRPKKIVYVPVNRTVRDEPPEKVPKLSYPNKLHPSVSESTKEAEQPYFPVLTPVVPRGSLQEGPVKTTNWPVAYRSQILKSYLRGQQVLNEGPVIPLKGSVTSEATTPSTSQNYEASGQVRITHSPEHEKTSQNRVYVTDQPSRINENQEQWKIQGSVFQRQTVHKNVLDDGQILNLDENGTLDLRKKHPAHPIEGPRSMVVTHPSSKMKPPYVVSSPDWHPAPKSVWTPGSVIVSSRGGYEHGQRLSGGGDASTARTVIVSTGNRETSDREGPSADTSSGRNGINVGTINLPTTTPVALNPSTVLAPEPSGQKSRYVIIREGAGNKFVIREVGSLTQPPVTRHESTSTRIEPGSNGVTGAAFRFRRVPSESGTIVAGEDASGAWRRPLESVSRHAESVIRTAPPATQMEDDDDDVVEVFRSTPGATAGCFEPTGSECSWADAEYASARSGSGGCPGDEAYTSAPGAVDSAADRTLRLRVSVVLWALLGGERLRTVGWPRAPVRRVLWRAVDVCCSVAGAKSAAAVPLPADHDCGADMACFRDHAHRFLEVCAPTRDHWKRYGWASLTIDAVVAKVYREDIAPWLRTLRKEVIPAAVRDCLRQLQNLEDSRESTPPPPPQLAVRPAPSPEAAPSLPPPPPSLQPPSAASASDAVQDAAKKKRGRPAKQANSSDTGRVERVMLWRFLLNLLEDPRNEPCIHWIHRDQGIFRILNTDWLARLWGRRHGNPRMTYEKMARAMRTYYRSKVLQPVPRSPNLPRKLVYKFNPSVVQRVAAANKLAQQQQQLQQQSQRSRQNRFPIRPQAKLVPANNPRLPGAYKEERQLSVSQQRNGEQEGSSHHVRQTSTELNQRQMRMHEHRSHPESLHHVDRDDRRPQDQRSVDKLQQQNDSRLDHYAYVEDTPRLVDKDAKSSYHLSNNNIFRQRLTYENNYHLVNKRLPPRHSTSHPYNHQEERHQRHSPQHSQQHQMNQEQQPHQNYAHSYQHKHQHQSERVQKLHDSKIRDPSSPNEHDSEQLLHTKLDPQQPHHIQMQHLIYHHDQKLHPKTQTHHENNNRYLSSPNEHRTEMQQQIKHYHHQPENLSNNMQQFIYQHHLDHSERTPHHHDTNRHRLRSPSEQPSEQPQSRPDQQSTQHDSKRELNHEIDGKSLKSPNDNDKNRVNQKQHPSRHVSYSHQDSFQNDHSERLLLHHDTCGHYRYSPYERQSSPQQQIKHSYQLPAHNDVHRQQITHQHNHHLKTEGSHCRNGTEGQIHPSSNEDFQRQSRHHDEPQHLAKETGEVIIQHSDHKGLIREEHDHVQPTDRLQRYQTVNDNKKYSPKELQQLRAYRLEHKQHTDRELLFKHCTVSPKEYPKQENEIHEQHYHNQYHPQHQGQKQEQKQEEHEWHQPQPHVQRQQSEEFGQPETQAGPSQDDVDQREVTETPKGIGAV